MRNLGKLTYSHTLTHACWQHSPGSHIHLARVLLCVPLGPESPRPAFMCHALALGRRGHTWGAPARLCQPLTHIYCDELNYDVYFTILAKAPGCLPKPETETGMRVWTGCRFFYSTPWNWFFNFSIFSASRLVSASNWCLIFSDRRSSLWIWESHWFQMHPLLYSENAVYFPIVKDVQFTYLHFLPYNY